MMYFKKTESLAWRVIDGQAVVVDLSGNQLFGLSPWASQAFAQLTNGGWFSVAEPAVEKALKRLAEAGLVQASPVLAADEKVQPLVVSPPASQEEPILWQEALSTFAKACLFVPGQSDLCNQSPAS